MRLPARLAPAAAAMKSLTQVSAASAPVTTTTQTGIRANPSAHAASAIPPNTIVAPGIAGRRVPATPIAIINPANTQRIAVIRRSRFVDNVH